MRIFLTLVLLTSGLACEKTIREANGRQGASDAPTVAADSASLASSRSSDEHA